MSDTENDTVNEDVNANEDQTGGDTLHTNEFEKFLAAFESEEAEANGKSRIAEAENTAKESTDGNTEEEVKPAEGNTESNKVEDSGKEKTGEDRGLERLAVKEKEVRELRTAFETERKAFLDEKTKFEKERNNLFDAKTLSEAVEFDPQGTFAKLGINSDRLMKSLLYSKLPENHPAKAKLREELRDMENIRRYRELEMKLEEKERAAATASEYSRQTAELSRYVDTLKEDGEHVKELPTVSKLAKSNLPYLQKRVLREVLEDARERYLKGETGDPLSHSEATARVEADLAELAKVFGVVAPSDNTSSNTKNDTKTAATPSVTKIKPAVSTAKKPKSVQDEIEDLEKRSILEGVAEFERMEQRRRSGVSGR